MHMQGTPQNMQDQPKYQDPFAEISFFFSKNTSLLCSRNQRCRLGSRFWIWEKIEHNYHILKRLEHLQQFNVPVLAGVSRKSMIYKVLEATPEEALNGTTVLHTVALMEKAQLLRVHDVKKPKNVFACWRNSIRFFLFLYKPRLNNNLSFLNFNFVDLLDIVLVAVLLFYMYKLVRGTVAINIFLGIVIIYFVYQLTVTLNMNVLSNILGNFISVGFFALIVVFQQEIRKFLLLLGSTNYTSRKSFFRYFSFLNPRRRTIGTTRLKSFCQCL